MCRRFRRKTPKMVSLDDSEASELRVEASSPDRQVDAIRMLQRCNEVAENELSPAQRKVFYLKFDQSRSTRSIAHELSKSSQAVKISLFRSRRTLSQHMPDCRAVLVG